MERLLVFPTRLRVLCALQMEVSFQKEVDEGQAYNLTGLQAFTRYVVALRCAVPTSQFWSGWSQEVMGTTEEEGKWGPRNPLLPALGRGARPTTAGLQARPLGVGSPRSWSWRAAPSLPEGPPAPRAASCVWRCRLWRQLFLREPEAWTPLLMHL